MNGARAAAALAAVLGLALAATALWRATGPQGPAPDVSFQLIDGRKLEMRGLEGRPVLVTFWSTTCGLCIKEMPDLVRLYEQLGPRGMEIVGVAMPYDRPDRVVAMARRKGLNYPVAIDVQGEVTRAFGEIRGTPTSFLIAPDGTILFRRLGPIDPGHLRKQVERML
ncbi:MAG: TlpA disulfide reductase family protein [Chromatiales bacterium]|jgi:peroxiredoxin